MAEPISEIQELIESADLAFDADNFREGSWLMWEATQVALVAIANNHGWPCGSLDELKEVTYRMDGIDAEGYATGVASHFIRFSVAMTFRTHAETDEWEYPEFEWGEAAFSMGRKSVKNFLALLTQYIGSGRKFQ